MSAGRLLLLVAALAVGPPLSAAAAPPDLAEFSVVLDRQWDYARPAETQIRFRAELARWPAADPQALIVATQIARTQSLARQFTEAHATLDAVAAAARRRALAGPRALPARARPHVQLGRRA